MNNQKRLEYLLRIGAKFLRGLQPKGGFSLHMLVLTNLKRSLSFLQERDRSGGGTFLAAFILFSHEDYSTKT